MLSSRKIDRCLLAMPGLICLGPQGLRPHAHEWAPPNVNLIRSPGLHLLPALHPRGCVLSLQRLGDFPSPRILLTFRIPNEAHSHLEMFQISLQLGGTKGCLSLWLLWDGRLAWVGAKTVTDGVTGDPRHCCHGVSRGPQVMSELSILIPASHSPPQGGLRLSGLLWAGPHLRSSSRKIVLFCVFFCFSPRHSGILRGIPGNREGAQEAVPVRFIRRH